MKPADRPVTMKLDADIFAQFKAAAVLKRKKLPELANEALKLWLKMNEDRKAEGSPTGA